jgi:hypothetical protein
MRPPSNPGPSYLPARPVIAAAAAALRDPGSWHMLTPGQTGVLAGWVAAGLIVALACFRWDPGRGPQPRRGTARLQPSLA